MEAIDEKGLRPFVHGDGLVCNDLPVFSSMDEQRRSMDRNALRGPFGKFRSAALNTKRALLCVRLLAHGGPIACLDWVRNAVARAVANNLPASILAAALVLPFATAAADSSKGAEASPCTASLNPMSVNVGAEGGANLSVAVSVPAGCPYDARRLSPFITVTNGATGVGSGLLTYQVAVNAGEARQGAILIGGTKFVVYQGKAPAARKTEFDFDGDGKADVAVYRKSTGTWYVLGSTTAVPATQFGLSSDAPVPADYDGDGKTDIAIYRPGTGTWYILGSSTGFKTVQWGLSTDIPVPADYDGDGKVDIAIFRPGNGTWYIIRSSGGILITQWGMATDIPVPADYDGDGKADVAIYRPSNGTWYVVGTTAGFFSTQFGLPGDIPLPADYDGDRKADIAIYRPSNGTWYGVRTTAGFFSTQFGLSGDVPVPADYDGDGKADIAVYRPSAAATWFVLPSGGSFTSTQWGTTGDLPVPALLRR